MELSKIQKKLKVYVSDLKNKKKNLETNGYISTYTIN